MTLQGRSQVDGLHEESIPTLTIEPKDSVLSPKADRVYLRSKRDHLGRNTKRQYEALATGLLHLQYLGFKTA